MKILKNTLLTIIIILIIIAVIIVGFLMFISYSFGLSIPSSGIWQYSDDDLEITIYVPNDGGISTPSGFAKCKAVFSYKGENQKAILSYHTKMYHINLVIVDSYDDIMRTNIEFGYGAIISTMYSVPMKKGEWEFGDNHFGNLVFKKIGKYKEPE